MNRKTIIAALAAAAVLGTGAVLYLIPGARDAGTPGHAYLLPAEAPTVPGWRARATPLAGPFGDPFGAVADTQGNLFVADVNAIRRIGRDGVVTTFAGGRTGHADGAAGAAAFDTPSALAIDGHGNLYVADTGNNAIRKVAPDGSVSTLAGGGAPGDRDGAKDAARFDGPVGVAVDRDGIVWVADTYNDRIRRIAPDGSVTTLAGRLPGSADGAANAAAFDTPSAIAAGRDGTLYVADTGNDAIRQIGRDGTVRTLALLPGDGDGPPALPVALTPTHDGYLYIGGADGRIVQRAPDGHYRALQDADRPLLADRPGDGKLRLHAPRAIVLRRDGSLVATDGAARQVLDIAPPRARAAPASSAHAVAPVAPTTGAVMPWPVGPQLAPHEVVGVMGEVRGSYDGESRHHFHAGLDIRADVGARVLAILPATISDPYPNWAFGDLGEGMRAGPLSYIHMRVGRTGAGKALDPRFQLLAGTDGKTARVRVRRGTRFAAGDALGTINPMAHVHLEYRPGGALANPLTLPFAGLRDTVAPRIQGIALYDSNGLRLTAGQGKRLRVARALGRVTIVADGYDQMDGNLARRRLGLYKLGFQLLHADGSPAAGFGAARITQVYDRLPPDREAVKLAYADSSGITVYGSKATRFAYAVNNTLQDGVALPGSWQVDALAPGDYLLRIHAADYAGQEALQGRDLPITIE